MLDNCCDYKLVVSGVKRDTTAFCTTDPGFGSDVLVVLDRSNGISEVREEVNPIGYERCRWSGIWLSERKKKVFIVSSRLTISAIAKRPPGVCEIRRVAGLCIRIFVLDGLRS